MNPRLLYPRLESEHSGGKSHYDPKPATEGDLQWSPSKREVSDRCRQGLRGSSVRRRAEEARVSRGRGCGERPEMAYSWVKTKVTSRRAGSRRDVTES